MNRVTSARLALACLLIGMVLCSEVTTAQAPAAPPAQALTYEMAQQVIDAAEAEARKNKWNVTIVVTDAAGVPVVLRRLTGASPRSYDIATRKAATVVATKLATSAYGEQLKAGTVKEVPNGITFAGGVPIMRGTEFIGAVGTSGVRAIEDEQISKAGAGVVK
ncbi:MAG: heme-binding protein [Acidobacteriota bacterium]|nr:heme-binding protein [Acidobacteriota bacterium]